MVTITGGHQRIFLVITNYRVLLLRSIQQFCGANRIRGYHTIASSSVLEASTAKQTAWCCIQTRMVQLESKTQEHTLIVKKMKDEDLRDFLTQLSVLIISNTSNT